MPIKTIAKCLIVAAAITPMSSVTGHTACVQGVTGGLSIRKAPSASADVLAGIPAGSCRVAVDSTSCERGWCKVVYKDKNGWVNSKFISLEGHEKTQKVFNYYIMRAVTEVVAERAGRGYDLRRIYSQDLNYGSIATQIERFYWDKDQGKWIYPEGTGETMCVAAVAEVLIEALNLYAKESGDKAFTTKLPIEHWTEKAQARHLRQHLWEYHGLGSRGAGHALERFNIGKQKTFQELTPGDTLKFNRINGAPGHSTIFVAYVDGSGQEVERYGAAVKGFKYFSAQGGGKDAQGRESTGLGYKIEYFSNTCPSDAMRRAGLCRVFAVGTAYGPNLGTMFHPHSWGDVGSNYRQELARAVYLAKTGKPIDTNIIAYTNSAAGSWLNKEVEALLARPMDPTFVGDWEN